MKISRQKNYVIRNQMIVECASFPLTNSEPFLCNAFFLCNGIITNGKIQAYLTFFLLLFIYLLTSKCKKISHDHILIMALF
jgi:hypothetical protein